MALMPLLALGSLAALFVLLVIISVGDIKARQIRNKHVVVTAALFVPFALAYPGMGFMQIAQHVGIGTIMFALTFFLFTRGWIGGGDAKLIPTIGLWVGPHGALPFILATAIGGALVALVLIIATARKRRLDKNWRNLPLPYGVAIAMGGVLVTGQMYVPTLMLALG